MLLTACGGGEVAVVDPEPATDVTCVTKYEGTTLSIYTPGFGIEDIEDVSPETAEEVTATVGLCN